MDDFEVIEQIGKGSFGIVQKIKRKSDGRFFVWKVINYSKMGSREKQQLIAEVNILRELKHINIVRFYDRIIDQKASKIYVIMEYCAGGDMSSLLKQCKKDNDFIGESTIWKMFGQIMFALHECHHGKRESGGKILHRDLKPANIFFDSAKNVKLGDFGLSRVMGEHSVFATTNVGTPFYMSPEQIGDAKYDEKSDIWSAGCLLYEMAALRPPFHASNHLQLAIKIKEGRFDRIPSRYSEELQSLIESMLHSDPQKRPSCATIVEMPPIAWPQKERKQRERAAELKAKDDEITKKNALLNARETALDERENLIKLVEEAQRQLELEIEALQSKLTSISQPVDQLTLLECKPAGNTIPPIMQQTLVKEGLHSNNNNNVHSTSNLNTSCSKSSNSFASTNNTFEIRKDTFTPTIPQSLANSQPNNYCQNKKEKNMNSGEFVDNYNPSGNLAAPATSNLNREPVNLNATAPIAVEVSGSKLKSQQSLLTLARSSSQKEIKNRSSLTAGTTGDISINSACSPQQQYQQQQQLQCHFKSVNSNNTAHSDSATPSTEKDTTTGRNTIPSIPSSAREPNSANKFTPSSQFISTSTDKDHTSSGSKSSEKRLHNKSMESTQITTATGTIFVGDDRNNFASPTRNLMMMAGNSNTPTSSSTSIHAVQQQNGIMQNNNMNQQKQQGETLKLRNKFSSHESLQLQQQQKQLIMQQPQQQIQQRPPTTSTESHTAKSSQEQQQQQQYFSRPRAVNSIDSTSYRNNSSAIDAKFSYLGFVKQSQQQQQQQTNSSTSTSSSTTAAATTTASISSTRYNSAGRYATNTATVTSATTTGQKSHNSSIQMNEPERQVNTCRSDALLQKKPNQQSPSLNRQSSEGNNPNSNITQQQYSTQPQGQQLQQQQQQMIPTKTSSNSSHSFTNQQRVPLSAQINSKQQSQQQQLTVDYQQAQFAQFQQQQSQQQQFQHYRTMHSRANSSNGSTTQAAASMASTGTHAQLNRLLDHHSNVGVTETAMINATVAPIRKKPAPIPPSMPAAYLNTNSSYSNSAVPPLPFSTRGNSSGIDQQQQQQHRSNSNSNSNTTLNDKRKESTHQSQQQNNQQQYPAPIPSRSRLIPPSLESTMQQQYQQRAAAANGNNSSLSGESLFKQQQQQQQSDSNQQRKQIGQPLSNVHSQQSQQYRSSTPVNYSAQSRS